MYFDKQIIGWSLVIILGVCSAVIVKLQCGSLEKFVGNLVNTPYMGFYDQPTGRDALLQHIEIDQY